jgi:tRNA threonylcarbamoyladenosine modification (KEOPS) complex  Pcc1 subunit
VFRIDASSIAPMRALLNSYIRWVDTSLEVAKLKGD